MTTITIRHGDCVEVMKSLPEASVRAVVCDPPYGLEFMEGVRSWQTGGGFSKPGIGERHTAWPSFSATTRFGTANPTCAVCGGRMRGAKKCSCEHPHDHWKPIGKRKNPENEGLPDNLPGSGMSQHMQTMQSGHTPWLRECFRVLVPGGRILAFGGSRVYHRMAAAFDDVGFVNVGLDAWAYGTGFPKSHSLDGEWVGWGTSLKPAWEPFITAMKP
jgi:DNA modification methylase